MAADTGDKIFDPTPRRRQRARDEGHVALSQDLVSAALVLASVLLLTLLGKPAVEFLYQFMRHQLGDVPTTAPSPQSVALDARLLLGRLAGATWPMLALLVLGGVLVSTLQTGLLWTPSRVAPDLSRISVLRGLQRIFSLAGTVRLGFGLLKLVVIVGVAGLMLWNGWSDVLGSSRLAMPQLAAFLVNTLLGIAWWVGLALLALGLLDYAFQRWRYEQDLRMTYEEYREERKHEQEHPQIDARRQSVRQQARVERIGGRSPAAQADAASALGSR
jgi:flagellar biosynthesis protein FlhB